MGLLPVLRFAEDRKQMVQKAAYIGFVCGAILGVMDRFASQYVTRGAGLGLACGVCCHLLPMAEDGSKATLEKMFAVSLSFLAMGAAIGFIARR